MTASNHAITGAAIALSVKEPWLAVPLAFASHFVLDYIPHFGFEKFGGYFKHKKGFHRLIRLDALLLACFLIFLFVSGAPFLAFICAFVACLPDLAWVYRYSINERFGQFKPKPMNWFNRWHVAIQTHIMKGFYIEIPYGAAVLCYVIFKSV